MQLLVKKVNFEVEGWNCPGRGAVRNVPDC